MRRRDRDEDAIIVERSIKKLQNSRKRKQERAFGKNLMKEIDLDSLREGEYEIDEADSS